MSLFVLFGALALGAGVAMIFQRNAVHAALLLVLNLVSVAVLFLTLGAEFLFVAQIVVYAGAIVVLFLFVIMLLGVDRSESLSEPHRLQFWQAALGVVAAVALLVVMVIGPMRSLLFTDPLPAVREGFGSPESLGTVLFQRFLLPFELTSLLLLVAAIGVLMLARRGAD